MSSQPDFLAQWARSVREHGDAPALVTPERALTYRAMDRLTDAWAASLAGHGAGPGQTVGLAFDDPAQAVLGMVAALKSGAGFTVLDDRLPTAARVALVGRTRAAVWVGDGGHAPEGAYVPDGTAVAGGPGGPGCGSDLAYVLFTSGSTGQPKGTVIERGSLGRFAAAVAERLALTPADRWLQVASLGFDVVIEEVFPALAAGAAVVCRPDTRALDAEELHALMAATGTTVVELSTQYWLEYARWLTARDLLTPPQLRMVVVGGERMDPQPYREWQRQQPAALAHVYGLTECTVSSTFYTGLLPARSTEVPLGTALRDVEISVRRDGRVVPDGGSGEIHIGGPLVARGFLDDEAATARRFVTDPLAAGPTARMYVTGDLGRIDEEGQLVFLGRVDDQLKIRGHRLEPAQVERALCESPGADQAVVFPDPNTGTALWAFTVPANPQQAPPPGEALRLTGADRDDLVAELAALLPDWAVPRVIHRVSALPKNPHGKIDKRRLIAWAAASPGGAGDPELAGSPPGADSTAEPLGVVLELFREVLREPQLGPDDNFFDHGGQSLLAMRLLTRLRESFPTAAGLRASALFSLPTSRLLSEALSTRTATEH